MSLWVGIDDSDEGFAAWWAEQPDELKATVRPPVAVLPSMSQGVARRAKPPAKPPQALCGVFWSVRRVRMRVSALPRQGTIGAQE